MKSEKILRALGDIDDRLVLDVIPAQPHRKKRRWPTWVMAAAMFALCVLGANYLGLFSTPPEEQYQADSPVQTVEIPNPSSAETVDGEMAFEAKIWAAPDPDDVGDAAKEAFITFFRDNPEVMDTYGTYDLAFSRRQFGDREIAVLKCDGPLMATTGDSQTFWYYYDDGTVQFGPSGTWSPETLDYAEAVRRMLTERSPADTEDYDSYVREAFTRYYIDRLWGQYQNELQYLPEFQPNEEIDMDPLSLFTVVMSELPDTFTEAEFAAAVDVYFDGISYVDGSCDLLKYENGVYQHFPMGLSGDFVYYQLTALSELEDSVYEAQFDGIGFLATDLFEQHEGEHSPNWEQLDALFGGISGIACNEVIQTLLLSEPDLEKAGFEVSEKLTVTFRLQEGPHPFRYLSCQRVEWSSADLAEWHSCSVDLGIYKLYLELPNEWDGAWGMEVGDNSVSFYQVASHSADYGGNLFSLYLITQEELEQWRDYAGFERVLATDGEYALVLTTPTDVQFTSDAAEEYKAMKAQVDSIADTAELVKK